MDELTRFARQLVERLATRPEGIKRPVSVAEVRKTFLPYRAQRRALGLESVEDYETVLLRLVAEERGYVKTSPPAAAERCREELAQTNPDLGVLEEVADSTIQLTSLAAGKVVSDGQAEPVSPSPAAPREASQAPAPPPAPVEPSPAPAATRSEKTCRFCHGVLPLRRTATFCPHCGERLIPLTCGRCGAEFESEWKHCITCGAPVQDPFHSS
jgi:DNA-directed RNA polymerase subunit RPC12/RpoP